MNLLLLLVWRIISLSSPSMGSEDWLLSQPDALLHFQHANILDVSQDPLAMKKFESYSANFPKKVYPSTDGEQIDVVEHYFWGRENGTVLELGALDGSPHSQSMSYDLQKHFDGSAC